MQLVYSGAPADHREQLPAWAQAVYFEDFTRDEHTRCLLAYHDGELVGIAAWWTARAHHAHYEFQLAVAPHLRRQGIGTALYQQARAQVPTSGDTCRAIASACAGFLGSVHRKTCTEPKNPAHPAVFTGRSLPACRVRASSGWLVSSAARLVIIECVNWCSTTIFCGRRCLSVSAAR